MFGPRNDLDALLLAMVCVVVVFIAGLFLTVSFFSTVARVLSRVDRDNRRMSPGAVWFNLIPVFNLIWAPVTVERVAESLRNEYLSRGMDGPRESYGRPAGLTVIVLLVFGFFFELIAVADRAPELLIFLVLLYLIAFGYWVSYWIQMSRYARELKTGTFRPPPVDEGW